MLPQLNNSLQRVGENDAEAGHLLGGPEAESSLQSVAGVCDVGDLDRLRRLVFRTTKGKSYVHTQSYDHVPELAAHLQKPRIIYIIMFWDQGTIRDRIKKICDSFAGERFDVPQSGPEIQQKRN
jgi:hypothetical protein